MRNHMVIPFKFRIFAHEIKKKRIVTNFSGNA